MVQGNRRCRVPLSLAPTRAVRTPHQHPPHNMRSSGQMSLRVSYPSLPPTSSQPDPEEYSPTASDIDALEESFLNLEIQSTQAENGTHSKGMSLNAESANCNPGRGNQSPASSLSRSSSMEDLEAYMSSSIEDRLPLVWRKSHFSFPHRPSKVANLGNAPSRVLQGSYPNSPSQFG